jgi:hypothetical protein
VRDENMLKSTQTKQISRCRVAWALDGPINETEVISTWPGGGNRTSIFQFLLKKDSYSKAGTTVKVPSAISYNDRNTSWGYQISHLEKAIRGVKLLLDEDQDTKYMPSLSSKVLLSKYNTDATQVTTDYLRRLIAHLKFILKRRFGCLSADLRYILSVPAVWSDRAKAKTLKAAMNAGIPGQDVSLISEPEAAAIYALQAIQPSSVKVSLLHLKIMLAISETKKRNNVFIVCDAGGGTVVGIVKSFQSQDEQSKLKLPGSHLLSGQGITTFESRRSYKRHWYVAIYLALIISD